MRVTAVLICWLLATTAHAQTDVVVTPARAVQLEMHTGSAWRAQVNAASEALSRNDLATAREQLAPAIAYCDALARPNLTLVSVATRPEYERYVRERKDEHPVEWVDHACPSAYKMSAFLVIEAKGPPARALALLDQAIAIAPYWAAPLCEKGFLLNQIGRAEEARGAYLQAIALQEEFDNAANQDKAIAWRGLGYTYIELGDLEHAQQAYEKSLELDPDSRLAQNELEYIRTRRSGP